MKPVHKFNKADLYTQLPTFSSVWAAGLFFISLLLSASQILRIKVLFKSNGYQTLKLSLHSLDSVACFKKHLKSYLLREAWNVFVFVLFFNAMHFVTSFLLKGARSPVNNPIEIHFISLMFYTFSYLSSLHCPSQFLIQW